MKHAAIISMLHELLKPLGFKKKGATWNRSGKVVEVINVQVSKADDSATINAGIMDRDVYELLWQKSSRDFVSEPDCTIRARIGVLIDDLDHWWPLDESKTPWEISSAVEKYVLPFLQRTQSREAMEGWLVRTNVVRKRFPLDIMTLAVIRGSLGKKDEALALLSDLNKGFVGAWGPRIAEVEKHLRAH